MFICIFVEIYSLYLGFLYILVPSCSHEDRTSARGKEPRPLAKLLDYQIKQTLDRPTSAFNLLEIITYLSKALEFT